MWLCFSLQWQNCRGTAAFHALQSLGFPSTVKLAKNPKAACGFNLLNTKSSTPVLRVPTGVSSALKFMAAVLSHSQPYFPPDTLLSSRGPASKQWFATWEATEVGKRRPVDITHILSGNLKQHWHGKQCTNILALKNGLYLIKQENIRMIV